MTLYWFLLVVLSLAFGSLPAQDVPVAQSLAASGMLVSGWILLIQVSASLTARATSPGFDPYTAARLFERQLAFFRWSGLLVSMTCLVGFKLAAAVQTWPVFESSMALQATVLLAPSLAILFASCVAEHRYGVSMGYAQWSGWRSLRELTSLLIASGGWILLPVFTVLLVTDVVGYVGYGDAPIVVSAAALFSIACIPFIVPLIIRHVWKTRPMDEANQKWIQAITASAGMSKVDTRVWDTGMRSSNAVIAGFLPGLRNLVLTDRLLNAMPRNELMLVILHEIAHVRRRHVWMRMLAMVPSWVLAGMLSMLLVELPIASLASNLVALGLTLLSLRWIAHRTEYDADQWACRMAMTMPASLSPPATFQESIDRYTMALRRVTGEGRVQSRASWLHPSTDQRCAFLQNIEAHNRMSLPGF